MQVELCSAAGHEGTAVGVLSRDARAGSYKGETPVKEQKKAHSALRRKWKRKLRSEASEEDEEERTLKRNLGWH